MSLDKYNLVSDEHFILFEFVSEGLKGKINKLIQFASANYHNIYNLGFGDKDTQTGKVDDTVVSNNGDSEKVLGTIVESLYMFTDEYPDALVYAVGTTKSRTRLYQIGISKFIAKAQEDFIIYGQIGTEWYLFEKNTNYEAFLVKRIKK